MPEQSEPSHASEWRNTSWSDDMSTSQLPKGLLALAAVAIIGGALTGLVGAVFRWLLERAGEARVLLVDWAHQFGWWGIFFPIVIAAIAVGIARLITTFVPAASGSGVQRVEGAMRHEFPLEQGRVVPAKFVGGLLAIGSGLALGREGPTVQMGASIGTKLGKLFNIGRRGEEELEASLAGAGLAVAFNAPIGGAIFVFEELTRSFKLRLSVATLVGGGAAAIVSRLILGNQPIFSLGALVALDAWHYIAFLAFGFLMGIAGAWYNTTVLWFLDLFQKFKRVRPEIKAAIVGGIVGGIAFFIPNLVSGGENIPQMMFTATPVWWVVLALLIFRWILGPASYGLGTPGGLFSPLLAVGALSGTLFAYAVNLVPFIDLQITAFAFVGMSALFAGVVRAPFTGIVIAVEMAAATEMFVPSLIAGGAAMVGATLMKSEPIYDTLRRRAPGYHPVTGRKLDPPDTPAAPSGNS